MRILLAPDWFAIQEFGAQNGLLLQDKIHSVTFMELDQNGIILWSFIDNVMPFCASGDPTNLGVGTRFAYTMNVTTSAMDISVSSEGDFVRQLAKHILSSIP